MKQKLFALASVTALGGLVFALAVAGCEPDAAAPTPDNDAEAGKPDTGVANSKDATPDDGEPPPSLRAEGAGRSRIDPLREGEEGRRCVHVGRVDGDLKKFIDDALAAGRFLTSSSRNGLRK